MTDSKNRVVYFLQKLCQLEKSVKEFRMKVMEQYGLQGADFLVFMILFDGPSGFSAAEICQETQLDKAQVSRSLKRLLSAGLAEKKDDQATYRAEYRLSPKGQSVGRELEQASLQLETAARQTDGNWEAFYSVCDSLTQLLNANQSGGKNYDTNSNGYRM